MKVENNQQELLILTKKLLTLTKQAKQQFIKVKSNEDVIDFEEFVKPFADQVRNAVNEWKVLAIEWVNVERPTHFHVQQILTTTELLEVLSIQVFFSKASQKHVLSSIQSVEYVLNQLDSIIMENTNKKNLNG